MKQEKTVVRSLWPLLLMVAFAFVLLAEREGFHVEARTAQLSLLPPQEEAFAPPLENPEEAAQWLVVYDSSFQNEASYVDTLEDVLVAMRQPYLPVDLSTATLPQLAQADSLLYCSQDLTPLLPHAQDVERWVEEGGHFALLLTPYTNNAFRLMYRLLGIEEYAFEYIQFSDCTFVTDVLPMLEGFAYSGDGELENFALPVHLEENCTVHLLTADAPLLWERPLGLGRVVVVNHTMASGKDSRGLVLASLLALEDTLVYPILNSAMVFIDDFPAPQPEGYDERLLQDFGYDTKSFFRHRWWPDMKRLCYDYGVRYSGVLIESYNDQVSPPFEPEEEASLLRFYASELLRAGGEVGLHGYNHMPLCLEGFHYPADIDYKRWPSAEAMADSILELYRYAVSIFPEAKLQSYVPPSNFLSEEGQAMLRRQLPEIRVLSGLYLEEAGVPALVQEFREEADGSISVPRLSSGYIPGEYGRWVIAQELTFHGVFSHFIHPDDVLDEARGAHSGWEEMYDAFVHLVIDMRATYPQLRYHTASEGAAAVQRYHRLGVHRRWQGNTLHLQLEGFVEEAWLALYTHDEPVEVQGAVLHPVGAGVYWLEATAPEVWVRFLEAP